MTTIVNLYGGPGTGKSTGAAYIFSRLKLKGVNCELVTEYAKDLVWESHEHPSLNDPAYITMKQRKRLLRLRGKVDLVITDSPLYQATIYSETPAEQISLINSLKINGFVDMNYFLKRSKPYVTAGRTQKEERAIELDKQVGSLLATLKIPFKTVVAEEKGYQQIIEELGYGS